MVFQIRMRFAPRSVTKRRVPSEVTDTGLVRLFAVAVTTVIAAGTARGHIGDAEHYVRGGAVALSESGYR